MKAFKIIFIILGFILIFAGILGVLANNAAGSCAYETSGSVLPERIVKVNKISPEGTTLDFDCMYISKINDQPIDKNSFQVIYESNLPVAGITSGGWPDYNKNWSIKAVFKGQTIEAEGSFVLAAWGYYLNYSHWILLVGFVMFIASFFIKIKKIQSPQPRNP